MYSTHEREREREREGEREREFPNEPFISRTSINEWIVIEVAFG
jgi:hypothetical protein